VDYDQSSAYSDALPSQQAELDSWKARIREQADTALQGAQTSLEGMLRENGIDPSTNLGAAAPLVEAAASAARGDSDAGQKMLAAGAAGVCLATNVVAPACLAAVGIAAFAQPLGEALTELFTQKTLPPSTIAIPTYSAGETPLSASEMVAVIGATEELRRREANVVTTLGRAYAQTWKQITGEDSDPARIVQVVSDALSRGGYAWPLIMPLPSYNEENIAGYIEQWKREGQSDAWITSSVEPLRAQCSRPEMVITCAPGNDLWRTIEDPPTHSADRSNAKDVVDELRTRASSLPTAVVHATGEIARMVAEDAAAEYQKTHGGMTPKAFSDAQLAAMAHAAQVSAVASSGAYAAYAEQFQADHAGLLPEEWGAAVVVGDIDPADYPGTTAEDGAPPGGWATWFRSQQDGGDMSTDTQAPTGGQASPSVEMGGPLDTTGASTGGSIMGPMVLLGAGFLTLAVFLARKRR
jgi:hypothetical protein